MFCFVFLGGLVLKKKKELEKKETCGFVLSGCVCMGFFVFFFNLTGKLICAVYANKNLGLSGVLCK